MNLQDIDPSSRPPIVANTNNNIWSVPIVVAIAFAFLTGGFMLLHWSEVREIAYPKFEIDSLTVSNFNTSTRPNLISADWNVKMNLKSMDKHGYLNFSGISVSIYYNVLQLGLTNFMSFDINPRNSTKHFDQEFSGSSGFNHDSIISAIREEITAGTVTFDVQSKVCVRKFFRGSWVGHLCLIVDCKHVKLFFGSSDKSRAHMLNSPRKCIVHDQDDSYS